MGISLVGLDSDLKQGLQELEAAILQAGLTYTLTSTVRSYREQKFLWDRYKAGRSALPAAPPGHSAHEYGWAFDLVVTPRQFQTNVGRAWETVWGGVWGNGRDPVHFELPGAGQLAWTLGEGGAQPLPARRTPQPGGSFYKLADFLSSFVPVLGEVQLVDTLVSLFDGNEDTASYYLQHPAEAIRDLVGKIVSLVAA